MPSAKPYFVSPGWRVLLQDLGLKPAHVLRRAGLPEDLFGGARAALSSQEFFGLWRAIEHESGDPKLPLRVGAALSVEAFDPPIFAALCSPDLNTALGRLAHYKKLIASMILHVDVGADATTLELEWLDKTANLPDSLVLVELVFFVQLARIATREKVRPVEIGSPHIPADRADYAEYFGVHMSDHPRPRVVFSKEDAARPFLTANDTMWQMFEGELKARLSELDGLATTGDRVHAALLELLPGGSASMDAVAKKLGTSPRTLQRRLRAEGRGFQSILDRTREALARHYLTASSLSSAEISFLLGYDDPNSFFRAFSAWTGTTPEQVRSAMQRPPSVHRPGFEC